jgi:hypothetical protein
VLDAAVDTVSGPMTGLERNKFLCPPPLAGSAIVLRKAGERTVSPA